MFGRGASTARPRFVHGTSLPPPSLNRNPSSSSSVTQSSTLDPTPPTLSTLESLSRRALPQALPPLLNYLDTTLLSILHNLSTILVTLISYHSTIIRQSSPGEVVLLWIDKIIVVTRAVSYLVDETKGVGERAVKLLEAMKVKDAAVTKRRSAEYFQTRVEHSEKWRVCREEVWDWMTVFEQGVGEVHYALTDEASQCPILVNLKETTKTLLSILQTINHLWLTETPALYASYLPTRPSSTTAATFVSASLKLHQTESAWRTMIGCKQMSVGRDMRSECASFVGLAGDRGFLKRDEMADGVRSLWSPFGWSVKQAEEGGKQK
ncbi:hypothetical protein MNV49_005543 [Pseudohyphozyma bogoriensis]|nr:hypothetical protein MNV49_005543 [Pseudohyphozyma bogoriensis]